MTQLASPRPTRLATYARPTRARLRPTRLHLTCVLPAPALLCGQALLYDWLLPAEVFNEKQCPEDDIWPCTEAAEHTPAFFSSAPRLLWSASAFKATSLSPPKALVNKPLEEFRPLRLQLPEAGQSRSAPAQQMLSSGGGMAIPADRLSMEAPRSAAPKLADKAVWYVHPAERGEACTAACAKHGTTCSVPGLQSVNSCLRLREHFKCIECEDSVGADQPAFVADDAPPESKPRKCLVNSETPGCLGAHPLTMRLCACDTAS